MTKHEDSAKIHTTWNRLGIAHRPGRFCRAHRHGLASEPRWRLSRNGSYTLGCGVRDPVDLVLAPVSNRCADYGFVLGLARQTQLEPPGLNRERRFTTPNMFQNLADQPRLLNAGNHPEFPTAIWTGRDVDGEYSLEALCPTHRRQRFVTVDTDRWSLRHDLVSVLEVGRKDPVKAC